FSFCLFFFFFQAEDGIRDRNVTGVQTCALPICNLCTYLLPFLILKPSLSSKIESFFPLPVHDSLHKSHFVLGLLIFGRTVFDLLHVVEFFVMILLLLIY